MMAGAKGRKGVKRGRDGEKGSRKSDKWSTVEVNLAQVTDTDFGSDEVGCFTMDEIPAGSYEIIDGQIKFKDAAPSQSLEVPVEDVKTTEEGNVEKPAKKSRKKEQAKKRTEKIVQEESVVEKSAKKIKKKEQAGKKTAEKRVEETPGMEEMAETENLEKKTKKTKKKGETAEEDKTLKKAKKQKANKNNEQNKVAVKVALEDMVEWDEFGLNSGLVRGLAILGYVSPTPIQRMCLPKALNGTDILGAAETGSGKTLAFALPVLNGILTQNPDPEDGLPALILTPTRELAVQVTQHIKDILQGLEAAQKFRIGSILGGMSQVKQERVLSQKPHVIVATPGRFWALVQNGEEHLSQLTSTLRYLVVDEADRMFSKGHFPDLKPFIEMMSRNKEKGVRAKYKRQTFLFSATLMLETVSAFNQGKKSPGGKKKRKRSKEKSAGSPLLDLMERIGERGKPAICSVVSEKKEENEEATEVKKKKAGITLPSGLTLCYYECLDNDKEKYLYYFVTQYPGRCLVFVNTISTLRRVAEILRLLQVENVTTLHANMQQKLRLKHLEKFTQHDTGVLVATDVAARGLHIPGVDSVIHYGIPRHVDAFVHRSGRTARASETGLCLALVGPGDSNDFRQIYTEIGKERMKSFLVRRNYFDRIKERVGISRRIEQIERKKKSKKADRDWFIQNAELAGIDLDEAMHGGAGAKLETNTPQDKEVRALRKQLGRMLADRIVPKGLSTRYVARGDDGEDGVDILRGDVRDPLEDVRTAKN
mmetsp:Transcript_4690/g.8332  ORF Transcript_4690/g.8332 Transcript_4690/m.8332 type:complete len:764 (+) Transcript_4690:506-2797(+)